MVWFCFGKENNSSRRVILKIELERNNLNSILSRSAVTPVSPPLLAQAKACHGRATHEQQCLSQKSYYRRKIVEKGKLKTTNFSGDEVQETGKIKRKEDLGTRVGERPVRRACSVHEGSMLITHKNTCSIVFPNACGTKRGAVEAW